MGLDYHRRHMKMTCRGTIFGGVFRKSGVAELAVSTPCAVRPKKGMVRFFSGRSGYLRNRGQGCEHELDSRALSRHDLRSTTLTSLESL